MAQVLAFAAVLLALGPQVGLDGAIFARLQDEAEDLLARPQSHGLEGGMTLKIQWATYIVKIKPTKK